MKQSHLSDGEPTSLATDAETLESSTELIGLARGSTVTLDPALADEPYADAVRDVLANADPSLASAVREFVTSQATTAPMAALDLASEDADAAPATRNAVTSNDAPTDNSAAAKPASNGAVIHDRFDVGRLSTGLVIRRDLSGLSTIGRAEPVGAATAPAAPASAAVPAAVDATSEPTLKAGSATQRSKAATLRVRGHETRVDGHPEDSAPTAIITESAEAVYVNEKHDTTEAPPLARELIQAELTLRTASPSHRPTEPTAPINVREAATIEMSPLEAEAQARAAYEAERGNAHATSPSGEGTRSAAMRVEAARIEAARADKIAEQRGFLPLRLRAWTTRTSTALSRTTRSQRVALTSAVVAVASIGVATAAIVWACSAVADAQQSRESAAPKTPAMSAPTTNESAPASAAAAEVAATTAATPASEATSAAAAAGGGASCALDVRASSEGAKVLVNGELRGLAPQTVAVPCGASAKVEIRHPRYAAFVRNVVVDGQAAGAAGPTVVDAKLEREKTQLTVVSEPAGATVELGGVVLGRTPLVTQVNRFEVGRLEFRADGYVSDGRQIVPKAPKKAVSITLKRSR